MYFAKIYAPRSIDEPSRADDSRLQMFWVNDVEINWFLQRGRYTLHNAFQAMSKRGPEDDG
jgi:hypothetical protein